MIGHYQSLYIKICQDATTIDWSRLVKISKDWWRLVIIGENWSKSIFESAYLTKSSLLEKDITLPKRGCSFVRTWSSVVEIILNQSISMLKCETDHSFSANQNQLPTSSFFDMKVMLRLYGAPLFGSLPRYLTLHSHVNFNLPDIHRTDSDLHSTAIKERECQHKNVHQLVSSTGHAPSSVGMPVFSSLICRSTLPSYIQDFNTMKNL